MCLRPMDLSLSGPIPVRILHAAQFHEFVGPPVEWGRQDGVSYVPKMRTQLVAARTVAQALAELATGPESTSAPESSGVPIPEIAGPREESLVEMAKLLVARRGDPVGIEGVSGLYGPAGSHPRRPDVRGVARLHEHRRWRKPMSDVKAIADRFEIRALRGEFTGAGMP